MLQYSFEAGINLYDTAPVYGFGFSEKRMGLAFHALWDKIFLISKGGVHWDDRKRIYISNNPKKMIESLEQSLKNLKTDSIDLYFIHWPDKNIDIRKPLELLQLAKQEGKIKSIGLGNTTLKDLQLAKEIVEIEAIQSELNIFSNEDFHSVREYCSENNISYISWGTLDKGIISGRVKKDRKFDKCDARSYAPWWKKSDKDKKTILMEEIQNRLNDTDYSSLGLALAYGLQFKEVVSMLVGMRNSEQVDSILNALEHLPDKETMKTVLSEV